MQHSMRAVDPAQPAAGYVGGKRNLARRLIEEIAAVPHDGYAEPFIGMGGVFLRRPFAPRFEAINDVSTDVATFFRILQRHYAAFLDMLRFQISSRREFERLRATDPDTLTDLERAARFLYLQRLAFGGKIVGRTFGASTTTTARFNLLKVAPMLEAIHERLAGVVIERLPWAEFIRRYDRAGMLFYLDPPYYGVEGYYGKGAFDRAEFAQMADMLSRIRGRFILSINDRPEVREIFSGFEIEPVTLAYTINSGDPSTGKELIIRGGSKGL